MASVMSTRTGGTMDLLNELFAELNLGPAKQPMNPEDAAAFVRKDLQPSGREYPKCNGKNCYPSRAAADRVRKGRMAAGAGRLRTYHCPECRAFHLASTKLLK